MSVNSIPTDPPKGPKLSLLALLRLVSLVLVTIPLIAVHLTFMKMIPSRWWTLAGFWHRTACRIMGLKVQVKGKRLLGESVLYVSNHISWKDILVLGGQLENTSFVAKAEVASWGMLGKLAAIQKTIFVDRAKRTDSARQRDEMAARVKAGDSLILFPEGTSTDGVRVIPFKSALFSVAESVAAASGGHLTIQPVTLSYTEVNGVPVSRSSKADLGWVGDVEMWPHLVGALSRHRTSVMIELHPPVSLDHVESRKELAQLCEKVIAEGLESANRGDHRYGPRDKS